MYVFKGILILTVALQSETFGSAVSQPGCFCPAVFQPVCADNGVTYSNKCILDCVSKQNIIIGLPCINQAYTGQCRKTNCLCTTVIEPVCGTNGRTYSNKCELNCYNQGRQKLAIISIAYQGQCRNRQLCSNVVIPVCGSDGRTYNSICNLQYQSQINLLKGLSPIVFSRSGSCKQPIDNCVCPLNYEPTCASNGRTYGNICQLSCENRRLKLFGLPQLTAVYKGDCNSKYDCPCTLEYKPVCGSDGNTYGNSCAFNCENKRRSLLGSPFLSIANYGQCESCLCPFYVDAVCGSDGKSYSNACFLSCENKKRLKTYLPPITIVDDSRCFSCSCTKQYDPVCGSDGRTYSNPCLFGCENKKYLALGRPVLTLVNKGVCYNRIGYI